jgi:hypothetical protein
MKKKIPGQPETQQQKSNVIDFEAERKKRLSKGRRSLQGPTTFDIDRSEETREYFRKSQEEARKEWRKDGIHATLFMSTPFIAAFGIATLKYILDTEPAYKEVPEPSRIEIQEQGCESHPCPIPGIYRQ